jgi:hypothetical protein
MFDGSRGQPVGFVERHAVVLARELRDGVGREQREVVVLVDRHVTRVAVDRGGRGIDDPPSPRGARGQQHVERAADVGLVVLAGIAGGDHDVACGGVDDDLAQPHQPLHHRRIADRAVHELEARLGQILAAPGEQVVQDRDLGAFAQQAAHQVAAHETRTAGDQHTASRKCSDPAHGGALLFRPIRSHQVLRI